VAGKDGQGNGVTTLRVHEGMSDVSMIALGGRLVPEVDVRVL